MAEVLAARPNAARQSDLQGGRGAGAFRQISGVPMETQALTQTVTQWLAHLERQGRSERTVRGYAGDLDDFMRWYRRGAEGNFCLADILPHHVENYKAFLQGARRAAPRTVNRRLAALSRFFKWALNRDLVRHDPTVEVRSLPLPPRQARGLSLAEEHRLRQVVYQANRARDIAMIEVLLGTGIRVGELLSLRRGDVVLTAEPSALLVREEGDGLGRRIPLPAGVCQALRGYLECLGESLREEGPLWWGIRGALRSPSGVNRLLEKYAFLADVEELTPQMLRHTFARRYLQSNPADVRGLALLLGHTNPDSVLVYAEPAEDDL